MPTLATEQTYIPLQTHPTLQSRNPFEPDTDLLPQPQGQEGRDLIERARRFLQSQGVYIPRGLSLILPGQAQLPVSNASSVAEQIAQQVNEINSLESIYVKAASWGFECWLVTNHSTKDERFRLYDIEWVLMGQMPDTEFKFHHIERHDCPLTEIATLEYDVNINLH